MSYWPVLKGDFFLEMISHRSQYAIPLSVPWGVPLLAF